ncbi:MAG: GAF domain-containing protein [Candidatus Woesearchaeota archaeon]
MVDITDLKDDLKRDKILFDTISLGIIICDKDGLIKSANKNFIGLSGYLKKDLENKRYITDFLKLGDDFLFSEKPFKIEKHINKHIDMRRSVLTTSDNSTKIVELSVVFLPNCKEFVFSIYDISQRIKMEDELKNKTEFFKNLYDVSNAIQMSDNVDEIMNIAMGAINKYGYDRVRVYLYDKNKEKLIGKKASDMEDSEIAKIELDIDKKHEKVYHCFIKKEPIVRDTPPNTRFLILLKKHDVPQTASIPLLSKDKVIGMISVDNKYSKNPIIKEDLLNLLPLSNQVAFAIENAILHDEIRKKLKRLTAMYDVSKSLTRTFDLEKILNVVVVKIVKLMKCDICTINLLDKAGNFLIPRSTYSSSKELSKYGPIPLDHSVSGLAMNTAQPVYIENVLKEPLYARSLFARNRKLMSLLSIPLITKDTSIGTINIYTKKKRKYSVNEIDLLKTLANQAAMSIKNCEFYDKINKERQMLSYLLEISQAINSQLKLDNMLKILLDKVMDFTKADSGLIMLVKDNILEIKFISGYPDSDDYRINVKVGEGISGYVAKEGKPIVVANVKDDSRYIELNTSTVSEAAIPLMKAGKVMGVLNLESSKYDQFTVYQQQLEILTNQIAIAIENSRLYHEISLFNETLKNEVYMATKELVEKNRELERMGRLKSDFVSNVSHELRTPLTSIKGYTKLLIEGKLGEMPDKQLQCMKIILEESDRLSRLINDVLDLAKLEKGTVKFKKDEMDIESVAKEVITTLFTLADDKDIKMEISSKGNIPQISASPDLIKQLFFNLIGNAIKFTPKNGTISVIIEVCNNCIKTTIKDTGIGIRKDVLPKLFDKFYQVDTSMTREFSGTGLGLPICKHIIDAHKGKIWVESELDKGSSFIFTLPLKKEIKELYE